MVTDRPDRRTRHDVDAEVELDSEKVREIPRPFLHGDRHIAGEVDDGRGCGGRIEQRLDMRVDVVVVNRAVRQRIPSSDHGLTRSDGLEVP